MLVSGHGSYKHTICQKLIIIIIVIKMIILIYKLNKNIFLETLQKW